VLEIHNQHAQFSGRYEHDQAAVSLGTCLSISDNYLSLWISGIVMTMLMLIRHTNTTCTTYAVQCTLVEYPSGYLVHYTGQTVLAGYGEVQLPHLVQLYCQQS